MAFVVARRYPSVLRRLVFAKRVPLARRDASFVAGLNRGLPARTAAVTQILPLRLKNGFATAKESTSKPAAKKTEPKDKDKAKAKAKATGNTKATKKTGGRKTATKKPKSAKKRPVLTPEQKAEEKANKERRALKQKIKALKVASLEPPKLLPQHAHLVAFPGGRIEKGNSYFSGLSDSEKAKFQEKADANKKQNKIAFEKWIMSHSPLEIRKANLARASLRRLKYFPRRYKALEDDRQVKPITGPYTHFMREIHSFGELNGLTVAQCGVRLGEIWRSLTETEKNKYRKSYEADMVRHDEEYRKQYHEEPPQRKPVSRSS